MVREISSRTLQMKRAEDLDFERLLSLFRDLDVTRILIKRLAKTDGPQGQIAGLGKGYEELFFFSLFKASTTFNCSLQSI